MPDKSKVDTSEEVSVDSLEPIPFSKRLVTPMSYSMVFWSSYIAVQIMTIGLYLMAPIGSLNFIQVFVACIISGIVFAIFQCLLGDAGAKYGIPFIVQIRSAFGQKGAKLVGIFRSIPAIIWNGICTWYGADALNVVVTRIFGIENPALPYIFFGILMLIEVILCIRGFKTIAWFDSVMSVVIFALLVYFFIVVFATGKVDLTAAMEVKGSWGWPFIVACFAGVAHMAACLLNGSDLSRQVRFSNKQEATKKNIIFTLLGALPPWIFMWMVGIVVAVSTDATNPIVGLSEIAPNDIFAILLMIFLMLAQVTSNLSLNLLCGGYVFQDALHLDWKKSIILTAVASVVICPWILQGNSYFLNVQNMYSVFLGPAAAILIVDYFVVRKKKLNIEKLYDKDEFTYHNGWNIPAIIALVVGWVLGIVFLSISWVAGFTATFIVYFIMKAVLKIGYEDDRKAQEGAE